MNSIGVQLQFFGALREHSNEREISVQLPRGATLRDLRLLLAPSFGKLVFDSAFADQSHILSDEFILENDLKLFVLPPVCGG